MTASASASATVSGVAQVKSGADLEFGRVWSSIFSILADNPPKLILCASPGHRQGVSTLAAGVALTAAAANPNLRLGLLDANLRSPSLALLFQIPSSPGVVDVLSGTADSQELGYSVGVHANLVVVPTGKLSADPLGLFRREKMGALITNLISRFDMLLIDTAPVNHYPDAQVLAAMVDVAVLVIDVGRTPREAVAKAKQILQTGQGRLVGTVLNRRSLPVPRVFYGRT